MSALQLDEFSLEMREHFINTTLESLERFKAYQDFFTEVKVAIPDWSAEAKSNTMDHFVHFLENLKTILETGSLDLKEHTPKMSGLLKDYLETLRTEADSETLYHQFAESLQKQLGDSSQLYLQCVSHTHHFVVPVKNVIEIVGNKKIYPLPLAQKGISGLMSFRGQGIPVVALTDFGFSNKEDSDEKTYFVVCVFEGSFFALEVHRTEDVIEFESSQFQSCSESTLLSPVVDHFVIHDKKSLMLLDIKKLVGNE